MESPNPKETRILGFMLAASAILLGLIVWRAGVEFPELLRPEADVARSGRAGFP